MLPYLLAAPARNLQPLFPNFEHDCRTLILIRMHGARFVMEVWTSTTTMRGYVWPVVSILNATMLSETLSVLWPTGLASGRNGNGRAFCFRKSLRRIIVLAPCRCFLASLCWISFCPRCRHHGSPAAQASQNPLAAAAGYAFKVQRRAAYKESALSPWLLKAQVLGMLTP